MKCFSVPVISGVYKQAVLSANKLLLLVSLSLLAVNGLLAACATLNLTTTNAICFGSSTGSITATGSGGVTPYKYSLNNAAYVNSGTFNNLAAGTYTIKIKDAANCITTGTAYVDQAADIQAYLAVTNVTCKGGANGSLEMRVEAIPPYVFKLNTAAYQNSNFFYNLAASTYSVTIKDGNGCTKTLSATITQPATAVTANATATSVTCPGSSTGTITISGTGGAAPYLFSLDGINYQTTATFYGMPVGTYTASVQDANGCVATKSITVGNAPAQLCNLGYPDNSNLPRSAEVFNESEVLRAFDPQYSSTCGASAATIKLWYSDEHAMTLGVSTVKVKTSTGTTTTNYAITPSAATATTVNYPLVGSTVVSGDQAGNDLASGGGRPLWPALFITDVTNNPGSRSGDWQQGGTGIAPHRISGTWKGAVKTIDKTHNPVTVTITPDADPAVKNHWNLGTGADAPPAGTVDDGYGCEVVWNVSDLGLIPGHTYHLQFMVHDGDQNKTGGDVGQGCTTIFIPGGDKTDETSMSPIMSGSKEEGYAVHLYPNPFKNQFHVQVESNSTEPINVRMFDAVGQLVNERKDVSNSYDLLLENELNSGIYFVEVKQGNRKQMIRLIQQN